MSDPVRREQVLAKAVQEGKIPPTRVDHWRGQYEANPVATEQIIASLTPGLLPGELESMQATAGGDFSGGPADPWAGKFDPDAGTGRIFRAKD